MTFVMSKGKSYLPEFESIIQSVLQDVWELPQWSSS